jgi:ligand-binding sensor domain-containing protein
LDTKTNTFKTYTVGDGLPDNTIKSVLEDSHGNLWLSTNKGISKFVNATQYPQKPVFKNIRLTMACRAWNLIKGHA